MNSPLKITLISNGHGEDSIAAKLIPALRKLEPNSVISAIPLVGEGEAFKPLHCANPLPFKNPRFPSGGFIRNIRDLIQDIRAGLISHLLKQKRALKKHGQTQDLIIAVGDIFCLWMAKSTHKTVFLPTAKSDAFMPHSQSEIRVMKKHCTLIFTRDDATATSLKKAGLSAQFVGNPMFDLLLSKPTASTPTQPVLGILPGSRQEAYDNYSKILSVLENLYLENWNLSTAIPQNLDRDIFQKIESTHPKLAIQHVSFSDLLATAWAVIGLAGTANEQSAFLNIPVFTFPGTGPQTSLKRFLEQQKLMGPLIHVISENNPQKIAAAIQPQLPPHPPRKPRTSQNAAETIAKIILEQISI